MNKRILSAAIAVAMSMTFAVTSVFAAKEGTVSITNATTTVEAGDTFTIDFNLTVNPGLQYMKFAVSYDEGLSITAVDKTASVVTGLETPETNKNPMPMFWSNESLMEGEDITSTGKLATITFKVADTAQAGTYNITIAPSTKKGDNSDTYFEDISFNTVSTSVTVESSEPEQSNAPITAPSGALSKELGTYEKNGSNFYNTGFDVAFDVASTNFNVAGITVAGTTTDAAPKNAFSKNVPLKTTIVAPADGLDPVEVSFKLNIKYVPEAVDITITSLTPYAN